MVKISVDYQGNLHCEATHGPSGTKLATDAPVDNQGRGESFSPTDLVATALATCIATTMGIVAIRDGLTLDGLSVAIAKIMSSDGPRRIVQLPVTVQFPAGFPPEHRAKYENITATCPVARSISSEIDTPTEFVYP
jgi:putative redox protein